VHGAGTVMCRYAFPRQQLATAPWDMRGPRRSWQRFPKWRDVVHDRDGLRGTLHLLMSVFTIF
jgi:hypothetical protein